MYKELVEQYQEELNKSTPDEARLQSLVDAVLDVDAPKPTEIMTAKDLLEMFWGIEKMEGKVKERFEDLKKRYYAEKQKESPDIDLLKRISMEAAMMIPAEI